VPGQPKGVVSFSIARNLSATCDLLRKNPATRNESVVNLTPAPVTPDQPHAFSVITKFHASSRFQIINPSGYAADFINLSGLFMINGSGDTATNYLDVGGATNWPARFYRVRLVP
jgi:hypothetical protein